MKYILTISLLLLGIVSTGFAQQDTSQQKILRFNLQECIQYALENQDSVKNARLDIESADYKVKETIGRGLPQVNINASLQDYLKLPVSLLPAEIFGGTAGTFIPVAFGVKYQSTATISASQLLFDGSYFVGLQASRTYKELYQKNFNRSKINTEVAVTKAYYQVLVSDEQIKLLDANIAQLKQQLDETTAQNQQGFVEKIDVDRLKVQYNNLLTNRDNSVRSLALGYLILKFQMGMPVEQALMLTEKINDIQIDATETKLAADTSAYKSRIEYSLMQTQVKLYELDLKRIKTQSYPTLSAVANQLFNYQNNEFGQLYDRNFQSTIIGLQLNIPVFSGLQRVNQIRQAKISVLKLQNSLHTVENGLKLEMQQAQTMYSNSMVSYNSQKENMDLAKEVLRVSKIKYEQGVGSSIEVTAAQTSLEQAENNYIQSLYNVLISKVDLNKAYGLIQ